MTTPIVITIGILLSVGFHFIGVYANAKKTVWTMIALMWAGTISIAVSEIKPAGYTEIEKMKGQFSDTDKIIEEAGEEISVYEMIGIKKSYITNNPKR
ncbi:MAG: hypothetical protein U9Q40_01855 [Campylobacterota bacterium]|nr:hypothetical protein [Campylobacterota bacterium]